MVVECGRKYMDRKRDWDGVGVCGGGGGWGWSRREPGQGWDGGKEERLRRRDPNTQKVQNNAIYLLEPVWPSGKALGW